VKRLSLVLAAAHGIFSAYHRGRNQFVPSGGIGVSWCSFAPFAKVPLASG
jgi:hypothetical protein